MKCAACGNDDPTAPPDAELCTPCAAGRRPPFDVTLPPRREGSPARRYVFPAGVERAPGGKLRLPRSA